MLIFLVITVTLKVTIADRILEDCPFDKTMHVDNDLIVDVLEAFYKDLSFVQASKETWQDLDYREIVMEMKRFIPSREMGAVERMVEMLRTNQVDGAESCLLSINRNRGNQLSVRSYLLYFKAEIQRLKGSARDAAIQVNTARETRQQSKGISRNELEKLSGLVAIQRVSEFNREVDKMHGFSRGPNFEQLDAAHSELKDKMFPLREVRLVKLNRIIRPSSKSITHSLRDREIGKFRAKELRASTSDEPVYVQINQEQNNFSGHTVTKKSVEAILCEFAQKLAIIGERTHETYKSLIIQLSQLAPSLAEEVDHRVVSNIEIGSEGRALGWLRRYPTLIEQSYISRNDPDTTPLDYAKSVETFAKYFTTEIYRRSQRSCMYLTANEIMIETIKKIRQGTKGVSLNKILELEGKIVLLSMKCFHGRLVSAYKLDGSESEQELESKRIEFGASKQILFKPVSLITGQNQ